MSDGPVWDTLEDLGRDGLALLPQIGAGLLVFVVFYVTGRAIRSTVRAVSDRYGKRRNLGLVLGRVAQAGVTLLGLLVALIVIFPSFQMADLIQLLGIGSVAIGFAFRDILQNFLAGVLILLTEPFRINDQIMYGSYEGTVEDIQTRATVIRTYDGRRVVIPNAELFTNPVTVNTAFVARRLEYDVGIGYGDDIDLAKRTILAALRGVEGVLADPAPDVLLMDLAPSSVNLRVRWWISPPRRADALDLRDQVLMAIKRSLTEQGIDLPYPTRQILFHDQTEATDGDRRRQREGWPAGQGDAPEPARAVAHGWEEGRNPRARETNAGRRDGR